MKYILTLTVFLLALNANSINYTTDNTGGVWNSNPTWDQGGSYPDDITDNAVINNGDSVYLPGNGTKITISELTLNNNAKFYLPSNDTLVCDSISIIQNADVYIDGVLIVIGGIYMRENSLLNLDATGSIEVGGDFEGRNNVDLTIDGTMHVSGDFTLGNGSTIAGGGSIAVDGEIDVPGGVGDGILPVDLLYFYAQERDGSILLTWATASEINNDFFTIEKSNDGKNFYELATVYGSGTTSETNRYSYSDYEVTQGTVYYRLSQTDFNGETESFQIVGLNKKVITSNIENIYSSSNQLVAQIQSDINTVASLQVTNINGQVLIQKQIEILEGVSTYNFDLISLPKGIYIATFAINGSHITKKFKY